MFGALPLVLAVIVGCVSTGDDDDDDSATTGTTEPEDIEMEADDFRALGDMTAVRRFFLDNPLGHLDEAIAVAENPDGGTYPVGTVIQLIPQEAMVKRAPGFDPASNDWEFFELTVTEEGTEINTRGGSEVVNQFGLSCVECHNKAEPEFDLICEHTHGCDPLPPPLDDVEVIASVQNSDPRPTTGD
jgi:hypothetical protein